MLFDGLKFNTRGYFAGCIVARKNTSNEQNVREYYNYVKPSNKRFLISLQKRCYFASILFGKSVLKKMHHSGIIRMNISLMDE